MKSGRLPNYVGEFFSKIQIGEAINFDISTIEDNIKDSLY